MKFFSKGFLICVFFLLSWKSFLAANNIFILLVQFHIIHVMETTLTYISYMTTTIDINTSF